MADLSPDQYPPIPDADRAPAEVNTAPRAEDGPQDVTQEPDLDEVEVADGDESLADPAVHEAS